MPSHQSSISGSGRSASYGGASVHSDVAATVAPPTQRSGSGSGSGVRLAQPAGLESLSRRSSVRESRVGSGLGNMSRHSESLQYGQPAQPAQSSVHSGTWRESLQRAAGDSETGSKLAGPDGPGSGRVSIADPAVDNVYRVESLHYSISAQSDPPSGQSGAWRESLQRAAGGSETGSKLAGPDGLERPGSGRVSIADYGAGDSGVGNMSRADSLPHAAPYTPSEPSGPEAVQEYQPADSSGSGSSSHKPESGSASKEYKHEIGGKWYTESEVYVTSSCAVPRSAIGHIDAYGTAWTHKEIEANNMIHIWTPDGTSEMHGGDYIDYYKMRARINGNESVMSVTQSTYDADQQRVTELLEAGDPELVSAEGKFGRRWYWYVTEKDYEEKMAKLRGSAGAGEDSGED